jgi:hypothetical protein
LSRLGDRGALALSSRLQEVDDIGGNVLGRTMANAATLIAVALNPAFTVEAEDSMQAPASRPKTIWEICAKVGEPERDRCMLNVKAKESESAWRCDEAMQRARRRCMLDVLEGKHPVAKAN